MKRSRILGLLLAGVLAVTGVPQIAEPLTVSVSAASKLAAPKNVKATVSGTTVKLTWSKVSGADKYRVYKYDEDEGTYLKYKDTSSTSCSVKNLEAGTHKFRVAALVKSGSKYKVQTKSSAVSAKVKSTSSSSSSSSLYPGAPIQFPAFGTSKSAAEKAMNLTNFVDAGEYEKDVYASGGYTKINGTECMVLMYFNKNKKFYYGTVIIPKKVMSTSTLVSNIKKYRGKPDVNDTMNNVKIYGWIDTSKETIEAVYGTSEGSMYLVQSEKYKPDKSSSGKSIDELLSDISDIISDV